MRRHKKRQRARVVRAHKPRVRPVTPAVTPEVRGYDAYDRSDCGYLLHGFDDAGQRRENFSFELDPLLIYGY